MNYKEAMNYINSTARFGSNYGLSRTERILDILGNPHKKLKCIHIAGTNGKGSTTAMITEILKEAGYTVGMYTSPYLEEFEERIQVNGEKISHQALIEIVEKVKEAVEKVVEEGYEQPTEFEIITAAAFLYYYKKNVDFAVIEVGLGGRLDSTNVITPLISVITSISYDHMNILGNTLERIAYEKAGIIKEGVPVVLYPQENEAEAVINKICREKNSTLLKLQPGCVKLVKVNEEKHTQNIHLKTLNDEYQVELSLLGKHQLNNCLTAVSTIEVLISKGIKINKEHILKALKKVKWIGRLEVIKTNPSVLIDGAHNIDGIKMLVESVKEYFKYEKLVLILGILADKQVEDMVKLIAPLAADVIAVTPNSERAELAEDLMKVIRKFNDKCEVFEDYRKAYKRGLSLCGERDLLLISGSLYMIGDMRKIIKRIEP